MRSIEVTGKTRQEATDSALKQLGVGRDEVDIEILDEGSGGFFGWGARPVRLRVTAEHLAPEPAPRPRQPERRPDTRGPRPQTDAPRAPRPEGQRSQERGQDRGGQNRPPRREGRPQGQGEPQQRPPRGERHPQEQQAPRAERPRQEPREPRPPRPQPQTPPAEVRPPSPLTEARAVDAANLLKELIEKMGIEVTVSHKLTPEGGIALAVDSPDSAILIGRKGRNLAALQYLINRMMPNLENAEDQERILVDIEGYLDRRRSSLEEMALSMGQRVKETGRRMRLKPLSAQERRVIHVTLQEDPDVTTYSVGDDDERTVVIAPRNESQQGSGESRGSGRRGHRGRRGRGRGGRGGSERPAETQDTAVSPGNEG